MSAGYWREKDEEIAGALMRARKKRMCLVAQTKSGVALLERRVRDGGLIRVFPHLYEEPAYWKKLEPPNRALRVIRSAAVLHPDWVFCGVSAAIAHGLEVSQPNAGVVHIVTSPQAHTASTRNVIRHPMVNPTVCTAQGVHVVNLESCVLGCIGTLDLPHGLAVADSYLRQGGRDELELVELVEGMTCARRRYAARRAALFADPRAENGGESMARGTMIELGYEIPDLQVEVASPVDGALYRVDFMWRGCGLRRPIIGELDGMKKYAMREETGEEPKIVRAFSNERMRESRLTLTDASVLRFRFADVLDRHRFARLLDAYGVPKSQ